MVIIGELEEIPVVTHTFREGCEVFVAGYRVPLPACVAA